jgi:filamentous hemagglutinin family protein
MSTNDATKAGVKFWGLCFGLGIFISTATFFPKNTVAQVVPDNTLPTNSRVTNQGNTNLIEGGTQAGSNLFHSFQQFSVLNNNTAFFNNGLDIQNIISRVTGGSISNIDGLIRANGTANLFLINPSGIVFGQNSQLNIGGSFLGSTANAIQFGNLGFFDATNPQAPSPLLTINPSALFYNQPSFTNITNRSVAPAGVNLIGENITGLRVGDGKSLALVGGNVNIEGGGIRAYGGRVELAGLTAPGEVGLNFAGDILSLNLPSQAPRGDVSLSNGAIVDTQARGGGSVGINALNFNLTGGSFIVVGIQTGLSTPDAIAGDIDINATGKSTLTDSSFIANLINPGGRGRAGNINLTTGELSLSNGAQLNASTFGQGNAGSIIINADRGVTFDNRTGVFSSVDQTALGNSGNISINSSELSLTNLAIISSSASGQGDAGNIVINARDKLSVAGSLILSNIGTPQRQPGVGVGNIGSILIEAGTVSVGAVMLVQ